MLDLTNRWPLGLDRQTWPKFALASMLVLFALAWLDVWASRTSIDWPDAWRSPFFLITDYGLADWTLIPSLVVLMVMLAAYPLMQTRRYRRAVAEVRLLALYILVGVGAPGLFTVVFKRIIGRSRPEVFLESGAFDFRALFLNDWTYQSFPSGHATTAIAIAFAIGFLWPRLFPVLLAIGILAGISRVPVGMHYPTDVVAGLIVGTLGAYFTRNLFARRRWLFIRHPDGHIRSRKFPALRRLLPPRQRAAV